MRQHQARLGSNIVGKSGRAILEMLAADQGGPATQADCALGRLRQKLPELKMALNVETDDAFRWMLSRLLFKLDWLDKEINDLDARAALHHAARTKDCFLAALFRRIAGRRRDGWNESATPLRW